MKIGTKVKKNPATWQASDFDRWGAGEGIGVIVNPPFKLDDGYVDVLWPAGRCFQSIKELIVIEEPNDPHG